MSRDGKRVETQSDSDAIFAQALNDMCHVCEVNPSVQGHNLCQQCHAYRMTSYATAHANAVAYANSLVEEVSDDDDDSDISVPPEDASYEDLLSWCQRREDNFEQKMINSTVAERFPVRRCAKTRGIQASCTICLCEYKPRDSIMTLPCFHEFHESCVREWLGNKLVCPICMQDVRNN